MQTEITNSISANVIERELEAAGCPTLVNLRAAAKFAGRAYDSIWRDVHAGVLRATRVGTSRGHWRVLRSELARYLSAR
jgi:hypothetical protein